jgi:hypothetical protein
MLAVIIYNFNINFKMESKKNMRRFFWGSLFVIFSSLLSQVLIPTAFGGITRAVSVLNPGDIAIITANSDNAYVSGSTTTDSNGFDFVSKVNLDAGTVIYFADKGWDGSLGTPFWRAGGEGALRYTVPAGGITAGTVVHYDDTLIPSLPSSGSGTWDMYSIDSTTGAMALSTIINNGFDPATGGDNILVFQGSAATPNFIFGIGWSAATTWISSGGPSTNSSWIPSGLSTASGTIVTLGSTDNYRYNCANTGLFSPTLSSSLQTVANWASNDLTPLSSSTCIFDASRPTATISHPGQDDPTPNNSINFTITFDQAIGSSSFASSDIILSGTGSGSVNSVTTTDNITWTVNVIASSEGTIIVSLPAGSVTDPSGNPNLASIITDDTVVYDTTPPATLAAPDMSPTSDSGQSDSDDITKDSTPEFTGSCVDGDTITILVDGSPITPTVVCASGTYSITPDSPLLEGSHNIQVTATDPAGNLSATSDQLKIQIDLTPPNCAFNSSSSFEASPAIGGYVDDPLAQITLSVDGNNYVVANNSGNWMINSGTISPDLIIGQSYLIGISCIDVAGNEYISNQNFDIKRKVDLAVGMQLNTTGTITSGQTVSYGITITNVDAFPFNDLDNLSFFVLSPSILDPGINPGDQFATSNSDIECFYFGDAGTIGDPVWNQYAGNNVFQCGFNGPTVLNPAETFSFDVSYTASQNLPEGLTNRILIYDDNNFDPDSSLIEQTAEEEGDIYGLDSNSVAAAVYKIPTPVDTNTTTSTVTPVEQLASTGGDSAILMLPSLLLISGALCAKLLRWKLN